MKVIALFEEKRRRMFCCFATPLPDWRRGFILVLLVILPHVAYAEDTVDLGTVIVEEAPPARPPSVDSTSHSTVIIPEDTSDPTATVPQLLEQNAGVNVKRRGSIDDFSAVSLRGSTSSQVQIYLDDIPLATAQGELADLSILPVPLIDSIEVYRGGSPGSVADSSAGGVIIIRSKDRPKKTETVISNMGGSFATYKGLFSRTQAVGRFAYTAAYERFQSDGDFTYVDNKGTTFNTADDEIVARRNNDFALNNLFTKFMFSPNEDFSLSCSNIFFNKDQGIPGFGNRQSLNARLETWRDMIYVSGDKDSKKISGLSGHMDLFFDFLNNQFRDPDGEIGLGVQNNDDDTYRFGANLKGAYDLGTHQEFGGFLSARSEFFLPKNRAATPENGPHSRRTTLSAGAEDEIIVFKERLTIIPSIRLVNVFNDLVNNDPSIATASNTTNSRTDHQISAKVGLGFKLVDGLSFKGNFYRGFRNPTFSELFGDRGTIVGNAELKPEESLNFDAGLSYKYGEDTASLKARIEAAYFNSRVDNLIQFLRTSQFTVRAENINRALIHGAEVSANVSWKDMLSAYASYTFQNPRDNGSSPATSGKFLPGRPRHEGAFGATWSEDWMSWLGTKVFGDIHYMSGNYLDTQNLLSVNHRTLVAAGLALVFLKGFTMSLTVKNILNDRISDIVGYPLPGRSYWASAELKLNH